jgi:D-alanyl-D-alanine carboxypeptidase (penicillin-binding protein 5/6)
VAQTGTKVRGTLPVTGGAKDGVTLMLGSDLTLLVSRGDEQRIQLSPALPESIPAPVAAGQRVGSVAVSLDGRTLAEIPVVTAEAVDASGLSSGVKRFWRYWPVT